MRAAALVAITVLMVGSGALAQAPMDAPPAADPMAQVPPAAPPLRAFQVVEVADPENPGRWFSPCRVITPYQGAVEVECNYTRMMVRDTSVRTRGGQPPAQSAAPPAMGPPFKTGDVVLASIMSLADDWRLCVVLTNEVASTNSYALRCAGSNYRALPQWVRADDGSEG